MALCGFDLPHIRRSGRSLVSALAISSLLLAGMTPGFASDSDLIEEDPPTGYIASSVHAAHKVAEELIDAEDLETWQEAKPGSKRNIASNLYGGFAEGYGAFRSVKAAFDGIEDSISVEMVEEALEDGETLEELKQKLKNRSQNAALILGLVAGWKVGGLVNGLFHAEGKWLVRYGIIGAIWGGAFAQAYVADREDEIDARVDKMAEKIAQAAAGAATRKAQLQSTTDRLFGSLQGIQSSLDRITAGINRLKDAASDPAAAGGSVAAGGGGLVSSLRGKARETFDSAVTGTRSILSGQSNPIEAVSPAVAPAAPAASGAPAAPPTEDADPQAAQSSGVVSASPSGSGSLDRVTLYITVPPSPPDRPAWDRVPLSQKKELPDVFACVTQGTAPRVCTPGAEEKKPLCPDALSCSWTVALSGEGPLFIEVFDQDLTKVELIGRGSCPVVMDQPCALGSASVTLAVP